MNLAVDQPLELALRPERVGNFVGGCWFGLRDPGNQHSGACRKDPLAGSSIGLCAEHLDLLRQWSDGVLAPDPRLPYWRLPPENTDQFPDMYIHGLLIG